MRLSPTAEDTRRAVENAYLNIGTHRATQHDILAEELGRYTADWAKACADLDKWALDLASA